MKIGSVSENRKIEKRIAITPDIAKKYISLGFDVHLSKNYLVSDPKYSHLFLFFLLQT